MFKEYDVVALKREVLGVPAPAGAQGTIVTVYSAASREHEVELERESLETLETFTLHEDDFTLVWADPSARRDS
jgi:uncharacterized protein DUF4926